LHTPSAAHPEPPFTYSPRLTKSNPSQNKLRPRPRPGNVPRSRPALLLLLSFQNATFATAYTPASSEEDLARARATAAGLLQKKLIVGGFGVVAGRFWARPSRDRSTCVPSLYY
jgi:hypothetical protein